MFINNGISRCKFYSNRLFLFKIKFISRKNIHNTGFSYTTLSYFITFLNQVILSYMYKKTDFLFIYSLRILFPKTFIIFKFFYKFKIYLSKCIRSPMVLNLIKNYYLLIVNKIKRSLYLLKTN